MSEQQLQRTYLHNTTYLWWFASNEIGNRVSSGVNSYVAQEYKGKALSNLANNSQMAFGSFNDYQDVNLVGTALPSVNNAKSLHLSNDMLIAYTPSAFSRLANNTLCICDDGTTMTVLGTSFTDKVVSEVYRNACGYLSEHENIALASIEEELDKYLPLEDDEPEMLAYIVACRKILHEQATYLKYYVNRERSMETAKDRIETIKKCLLLIASNRMHNYCDRELEYKCSMDKDEYAIGLLCAWRGNGLSRFIKAKPGMELDSGSYGRKYSHCEYIKVGCAEAYINFDSPYRPSAVGTRVDSWGGNARTVPVVVSDFHSKDEEILHIEEIYNEISSEQHTTIRSFAYEQTNMNTIKKYQKFIDEVIVKVDEFTLMEMGNDIRMLKGFVSEIAQRMQGAGMVLSGGMRFG